MLPLPSMVASRNFNVLIKTGPEPDEVIQTESAGIFNKSMVPCPRLKILPFPIQPAPSEKTYPGPVLVIFKYRYAVVLRFKVPELNRLHSSMDLNTESADFTVIVPGVFMVIFRISGT